VNRIGFAGDSGVPFSWRYRLEVQVLTVRGARSDGGPITFLLVHTTRETRPTTVLPLGMLRVAEACEAGGEAVAIADLAFARSPRRALLKAVARHQPMAVGFSVRNIDNADADQPRYYLPAVRELVDALRAAHPEVAILAGGAGVSLAPGLCREALGVDCIVAGPGERTVPGLLQAVREGGREALPPIIHGIPGPCAAAAQFARWLDLRPYKRRGAPLNIQSRRGCPYSCVYCNYSLVEGADRYEMDGVAPVVEALQAQVEATGIRDVEFVDSTFNSPPEYAVELCEALAKVDLGLELQASGITPRHGSREMLEAMKAAGFRTITCSPDAASPVTIESYGKGFTLADLENMARNTAELDLRVMWSFMFGGPGETEQTLRDTIHFIEEHIHPHDLVMLTARMRVYPGTQLAAIARDEGSQTPVLDPKASGQFYLSPALDAETLDAALAGLAERNANIMRMQGGQRDIVGWIQRMQSLSGKRGPTWAEHPAVRRRG
jgi:hypothetical protein